MLSYPDKEGRKYVQGSIPDLSARQKVLLGIAEKEPMDIGKALSIAEMIDLTQEEFTELFDHCLLTRRQLLLIAWGHTYHPGWKLQV